MIVTNIKILSHPIIKYIVELQSVAVVLVSLCGMCFNTFPWMQVGLRNHQKFVAYAHDDHDYHDDHGGHDVLQHLPLDACGAQLL